VPNCQKNQSITLGRERKGLRRLSPLSDLNGINEMARRRVGFSSAVLNQEDHHMHIASIGIDLGKTTCQRTHGERRPRGVAGDYNVVPTPQDIYPTRSLDNNALIQPESRQAFARLLAQGWTDALRRLRPDGPLWTFWDYKFERWQKDKGMRLDHFLLSPNLWLRLLDADVDRWETRATMRQHG
jgi:exonuclease III